MHRKYKVQFALVLLLMIGSRVQAIEFQSSDSQLQGVFTWAKDMALSYSHDASDPVGYWYEAALPGRAAFCMRDVSHQCVGGELLGLHRQNKNMMDCFVRNISESRDWCTFWEIDKLNRPCPADYESDQAFWYVLNANFDLIQACLKLYQWTGNRDYIEGHDYANFQALTFGKYMERWDLLPEKIMQRAPRMNVDPALPSTNKFYHFRGLPSYVESIPNITVSADLIASIYAGCRAYEEILRINGKANQARKYGQLAHRYRELLENEWWDESQQQYRFFKMHDGRYRSEGVGNYILWFQATENGKRIKKTISNMLVSDPQIEDMSYVPQILYRYNMNNMANTIVARLPFMNRSEYPEASYALIESISCGLMGIEPDYETKSVSTLYRGDRSGYSELKEIPLWGGHISVRHEGHDNTTLENNTKTTLTVKASFPGKKKSVKCDDTIVQPTYYKDLFGNTFTQVTVKVPQNKKINITCKS
jgi:hypothetical protein